MSGVGIQWQFVDMAALNARIDHMANMDMRPLMDAVGAEVETQTKRRIHDEKTTPEGEAWEPWSDRYAKTRTSGQSLLESEGDLVQGITHVVEMQGKEVDIGSNLIYARMMNDGGAAIGKPWMLAREYLGISASNRNDLIGVVNTWLDNHFSSGALI